MNNRTYAEQQKQPLFDWLTFLDQHKFSEDQLWQSVLSAKSWTTCACGAQCAAIPRDSVSGAPVDAELAIYGGDFFWAVKGMWQGRISDLSFEECRIAAMLYLCAIETRSAELIAKIRAKKIKDRT